MYQAAVRAFHWRTSAPSARQSTAPGAARVPERSEEAGLPLCVSLARGKRAGRVDSPQATLGRTRPASGCVKTLDALLAGLAFRLE